MNFEVGMLLLFGLFHHPTLNIGYQTLPPQTTPQLPPGGGFINLKEFTKLNTNGIDFEELLESLKDAFSVFDVDKNGLITAYELKNVLGSLGEEFSIGECQKIIVGVDQDGDGVISFEEFKLMMMNGSRFGASDS